MKEKHTLNSLVNTYSKAKITDDNKRAYIKFITLKVFMLSVMEKLRETNIYQGDLKRQINITTRVLNREMFENRYFDAVNSDGVALEAFEQEIEFVSEQMASVDLGAFAVMARTLNLYKVNPDFVCDRLNILRCASDEIEHIQRREDIIGRITKLPFNTSELIEIFLTGLENTNYL